MFELLKISCNIEAVQGEPQSQNIATNDNNRKSKQNVTDRTQATDRKKSKTNQLLPQHGDPLRKHAYSKNIENFTTKKKEKKSDKKIPIFFRISVQNIDCGYTI